MNQSPDTPTATGSASQGFFQWMQDPLGSIIFASVTAMGSLAIVISGIWMVDFVVS